MLEMYKEPIAKLIGKVQKRMHFLLALCPSLSLVHLQ